jgi:hypothetical protein
LYSSSPFPADTQSDPIDDAGSKQDAPIDVGSYWPTFMFIRISMALASIASEGFRLVGGSLMFVGDDVDKTRFITSPSFSQLMCQLLKIQGFR